MEYNIDTTELTPTEIDYHIIWAKVMLGAKLDEVKFLLEQLAQTGENLAISAWCKLFNYGENANIDQIVEARVTMEEETAKDSIADGFYDIHFVEDKKEAKRIVEKILESFRALDKVELHKKKNSNIKNVKKFFTISGKGLTAQDAKKRMEKLLKTKEAKIYDVKDVFNYYLSVSSTLTKDQKTILNQISNLPYSQTLDMAISQTKQL